MPPQISQTRPPTRHSRATAPCSSPRPPPSPTPRPAPQIAKEAAKATAFGLIFGVAWQAFGRGPQQRAVTNYYAKK